MPETILFIDSNYLAHRAHFSTGALDFGDLKTGALYGFFRDVAVLRNRFSTDQLVFCFDHGDSLRRKFYPSYKAAQKKTTIEQRRSKTYLYEQIDMLKEELLDKLGFINVFYEAGYEADDIIASALKCHNSSPKIIVSGDGDLYQLLDNDVSLYNPRSKVLMTSKKFRQEYGIAPCSWKHVKAIAGCQTDNVKGIRGVGEATALKYIRNLLDRDSRAAEKIRNGKETWERNLQLVGLPLTGCPEFNVVSQPPLDERRWKEVVSRFGMKSLRNKGARGKGLFDD